MLHMPQLSIGQLGRVAVCMDLVFQHVSRNHVGIGSSFDLDGRVRIRDGATGRVVAQAAGRGRVVALMRSLHENLDLRDIQLGEILWSAAGFSVDWSCVARNWGTGPTVRLTGSCRADFDGALIGALDLSCDGAAYRALMSLEP
ncbi:MAG: hypothetical protein JWN93_889 [Hyphomicrobiales bacterium]|nr:hypothetical protein [Hyphomicrobiales bacterium]